MKYLTTFIIIIIVSFMMRHLQNLARKKPIINEDGAIVLKFPRFMAAVGYISIAFGVLIGVITVFQIVPTTGNEVVPYLVTFFVILGLPMVLITHCFRVLVTDEKILRTGITKKVKEIRWDEVRKVTFSFTSELVLQSENAKIKLNIMLAEFESFVELLKQKLEPAMYEKALQDWRKTLKNMERR